MANPAIRIIRCEAKDQWQVNVLQAMQLDLLESDKPVPSTEGYWWVAQQWEDERWLNIAFAVLKVCRGTTYGYLARSGVYPTHRGKGLQRKLIAARERYARKLGLTHMVCDTSRANLASSNSLIACGYKLYTPQEPWSFDDGNYWIKKL